MLKIGITHGDYNGIGYEVVLKALSSPHIYTLFTPVFYGSPQVVDYYRKLLELDFPIPTVVIKDGSEAQEGSFNIVATDESDLEVKVITGEPSRHAGALAARALTDARADLQSGHIDAVVTAPINKDMIQSDLFAFKGHTEFFAEPYPEATPLMHFISGDLRVALVTTHCPLQEVSSLLTQELILDKLTQWEAILKQDYGIVKPRIAVLGLNPHNGENGLIGSEERDVIVPALKEAWQRGIYAFGPLSPDGFWGSRTFNDFDAVLCMYHDQGLIPFKLLAMDIGVNITGGLPIVRTSPDHGTAYDIAGAGVANEESMRNAIYLAIDILRNRARYAEMTAHPLTISFKDKKNNRAAETVDNDNSELE